MTHCHLFNKFSDSPHHETKIENFPLKRHFHFVDMLIFTYRRKMG